MGEAGEGVCWAFYISCYIPWNVAVNMAKSSMDVTSKGHSQIVQ